MGCLYAPQVCLQNQLCPFLTLCFSCGWAGLFFSLAILCNIVCLIREEYTLLHLGQSLVLLKSDVNEYTRNKSFTHWILYYLISIILFLWSCKIVSSLCMGVSNFQHASICVSSIWNHQIYVVFQQLLLGFLSKGARKERDAKRNILDFRTFSIWFMNCNFLQWSDMHIYQFFNLKDCLLSVKVRKEIIFDFYDINFADKQGTSWSR